jgi:hypothetical protein
MSSTPDKVGEQLTDERLREIEERAAKASPGPWRSLRDGNQYIQTSYLPTAKCVGASRVEGLVRPWNPHGLLAFGFKPSEYETARFLDADADFVAHAREDIPALIAEVGRLSAEVAAASRRGAEAERLADVCGVCCALPLASGRPCICGGVGTADAERQGLRRYIFELEAQLESSRAALSALEEWAQGEHVLAGMQQRHEYNAAADMAHTVKTLKATALAAADSLRRAREKGGVG